MVELLRKPTTKYVGEKTKRSLLHGSFLERRQSASRNTAFSLLHLSTNKTQTGGTKRPSKPNWFSRTDFVRKKAAAMKQYGVPSSIALLTFCCVLKMSSSAFQGDPYSLCPSLMVERRRRGSLISSFASSTSSLQAKKKSNSSNSKKPSRFTQTVHNRSSAASSRQSSSSSFPNDKRTAIPPPPAFSKDRMWRSNSKSIEDLEAKLASRWGTNDLSRWTADDVEDDDDDDLRYATEVLPSGQQFRAKPVADPWALDEEETKVEDEDTTTINKRIPKQSSPLPKKKVSPLSAFGAPPPTKNKTTSTTPKMDLKHLIAEKPVGGRGTNKDILSSEPKRRPSTKEAVPVTDAQGKPLFLTTQQADAFFEESLEQLEESGDPELFEDLEEEEEKFWKDLGITNPLLLENLQKMGCPTPLAVQRNSCDSILDQTQDVVVGTYTGSGKTLAFLVPVLQRLLEQHGSKDDQPLLPPTSVLIVAPGRELASQIASVARELTQGIDGASVLLAIGGTTFARNLEQIRKRKPSILVGTPGRLAELIVGRAGEKRGRLSVTTKNLQTVVLDEFDALLEYKPHRDPTNAIMETLKRGARGDHLQTILCSATATDLLHRKKTKSASASPLEKFLRPNYVVTLADKNDILVTAAGKDSKKITTRVSRTVLHGVVHCAHRRLALETLRRILHTDPLPQQILIFAADSRRVKVVVDKLGAMGIIAAPLHGGMGSEKTDRAEISKALREGYVGIVVATELAARGLDAPLLTHVINIDMATDASHYAHRAGRCGRGGRPGVVINLTTSPQERNVPQKFADQLGITMHTVEVKNSKLNMVDPESLEIY